ncbi:winged helix-turn-helix transcriptional regulator [Treponema pectinovorum]|uniref:ArsR/SmtB family transcription factor n=1 Tax=Treponema pectinovorum TaxID=164 RepID=UPI003D91A422
MIHKEKMQSAIKNFEECSPLFTALGDKVRQKLILDLADAGFKGINVQNLAAKSLLSRPAISHHLKLLKDAGIVDLTKKGTESFYRLCIVDKLPIFKRLIEDIESIITDMDDEERKFFYRKTSE